MNQNIYILIKGYPVQSGSVFEWSRWMATADRVVSNTKIGDVRISTVFLGLDYSFVDGGPPVLWETMVFGGDHSGYMDRYTSLGAAKKGHAAVEMVLKANAK